jgi:hypothetical protein
MRAVAQVDLERLRKVTVFSALAPEQLQRLTDAAEVTEHPEGSIDLYTGSDFLIMGGTVQHLELVPDDFASGMVEHHEPGTGGALVDRPHELRHVRHCSDNH